MFPGFFHRILTSKRSVKKESDDAPKIVELKQKLLQQKEELECEIDRLERSVMDLTSQLQDDSHDRRHIQKSIEFECINHLQLQDMANKLKKSHDAVERTVGRIAESALERFVV